MQEINAHPPTLRERLREAHIYFWQGVDNMSPRCHCVHMRTRKPITRDEILSALELAEHDVERAALLLEVSGRTLYRRMAELGIKRSDRYEAAEAA